MATKTLVTAEEFLSISTDAPCELVRGEVVEMPPPGTRHGRVCNNVGFVLESWARHASFGVTCTNDTGVRTERDPDTVRGADVAFFTRDRLPNGIPTGLNSKPPNLCVEVLSPSDRWIDVIDKIGEYLRVGVDEVWIVDPEERWVEVHRADATPRRLGPNDRLTDSVAVPGFETPVSEFFRDLD